MRKPYPTDLSDAEWKYIEPHLPVPKGHGRPRIHSLREILNAIFYLLNAWCELSVRDLRGRCPRTRVGLLTDPEGKGTDSSWSTWTPSSPHSTSWRTTST